LSAAPAGPLFIPTPWIGYTELRTDVPGGRAANIFTMRTMTVRADGTGRREVAPQLVANANCWTQFAGWSPDGRQAIIVCGWEQRPEPACGEAVDGGRGVNALVLDVGTWPATTTRWPHGKVKSA
jgi:hypothetical protein